jgi:hypothetical protein
MEQEAFGSIRGFNYIPGYSRTDMAWWDDFRSDVISRELSHGRDLFPSFTTVRVFLGYNAYLADPVQFGQNLEAFLAIADDLGLATIPTLFNRWHTGKPDFGGIYIDHFLPGRSYLQFDEKGAGDSFRTAIAFDRQFAGYVAEVVGAHAADARISLWDLCNEPFFAPAPAPEDEVTNAEYSWLGLVAEEVRSHRPSAPITIGTHALHGVAGVARVEPLCDVLSTHPYVDNIWYPDRDAFLVFLDELVDYATTVGKPILASETVWGSLDDAQRVGTLRFTLDALSRRGIGFLCYGLNHSRAADLHRPEFGSVGSAGSCAFIESDGRLRVGHEAFNEY